MEDKKLLALLLIGGAALYLLTKDKKCACSEKKNMVNQKTESAPAPAMTVPSIGAEIKSKAVVQEVAPPPTFGVPMMLRTRSFFETKAGF
mgnify:CR=1 FL=1